MAKGSKVPDGFWSEVRKSSCPHFTEDQIRELIRQLKKVAGHAITDTNQIGSTLEDCAVKYFSFKAYIDASPRSGTIVSIYKNLTASTTNAREIVEALLKNDYVARPMLGAIFEKVSPNDPGVSQGNRGHLMEMLKQLSRLEEWSDQAREIAVKEAETDKGGGRQKSALPLLIEELADLYEETTGKKATTTFKAYRDHDQRGGKFVDFVKSVLAIVEPGKERKALAQTIHVTLTKRRKRTGS